MEVRESKTLEFKENITKNFLKTVSAYANYGTGTIKFGIRDDGTIVGVAEPEKVALNIENSLNDSINPLPKYDIDISKDNVISLKVYEGKKKPYLYKAKAYRRRDSATIEVDTYELKRLLLEGENITFDSLISKEKNLEFKVLEDRLKKVVGIEKLSKDTLLTLELYKKDEGYTVAGELLADENSFVGIDMAKFGATISIFSDRAIHERISILSQFDKALEKYRQYYKYEEIKGAYREVHEKIPEMAFREALANALVHRTWDVNAMVKISMFDDRIEIASPGGLPKGLSKQEYIDGQISVLRNPILASVFFRLKIIERFGTGVQRIIESYENSRVFPKFSVYDSSIKIILPVVEKDLSALSLEEKEIYDIVCKGQKTTSQILENVSFGKTKLIRILNQLIDKSYISKEGSGRTTKYNIS